MSPAPIRTWPAPARRLTRASRSARPASRSNVASPPTGASSAANAASDGAARAITLGVTGDSLARRCVSLAPAASVADSVSRACCSPSCQAELGGPVDAAFRPSGEVDLRLRRPPGDAELAIHHHDRARRGCARRRSWPEQRVRAARPIAAGRPRQLRQQIGDRRCLSCGRRLAAVGRLGQAAEIEAERAVGRPHQRQLRRIQRHRPRHDAPEQQFVHRQRDVGARDVHAPSARLVDHRDVGQPQIERPIDPHAEALPGQRGGADRQPRRAAIGVRRILQPSGEPRQIDRPLRQPPGERRDADAAQHHQRDRQRDQPVQCHRAADRRLTGETPHAQPSAE